ncbi:MAG: ABC transporter permease [Gaiellaceae bacterium MAG52_C11]|nr:ABC transporter permease [Candidatus Gaiellasilicea maunaloa]
MIRLVVAQLRQATGRTWALTIALLAASLSFVLLASAAKTSDVRLRGSVEAAFRPAYDILVRPSGSFTETEKRDGLVRDNYLSGLFGGISLEQWETIKALRAVEVAAPIANVGFVLAAGVLRVGLDEQLTDDNVQVFRVKRTFEAHGGRSRYADGESYVYYTRNGIFEYGEGGIGEVLPSGERLLVCLGLTNSSPPRDDPFDRTPGIACYSELSPGQGTDNNARYVPDIYPLGKVGWVAALKFPMLLAAIDPIEEAKLVGLDSALVAGRYLRRDDRATIRLSPSGTVGSRSVPVLASAQTYVDERLVLEIEQLRVPAGVNVPKRLASREAYSFLTRLPGRVVDRRVIGARRLYEPLVRGSRFQSFNYWIAGDVEYRPGAQTPLRPKATTNSHEIWKSPFFGLGGSEYEPAPAANADVQFRKLKPHTGSHIIVGDVIRTPELRIVGRYDPGRLPGFNPLSRVPLETYYPPLLEPGDEAAEEALGGRALGPSQNLGDYVQQPPLLLTTLEGMRPFLNPVFFKGAKGRAKAPISAIRVRVAGVTGPDELSLARIRLAALAIRERTGLDVDITAGSSPRKLLVELPPGKFGRPRLLLEEGWVKKGVSVTFLRAADRKSIALAGLILLACGFFVGHGAYAAVRSRRREIGTLVCVGWPRRSIFGLVLAELALVGCVAGVVGAAIPDPVAALLSLEL